MKGTEYEMKLHGLDSQHAATMRGHAKGLYGERGVEKPPFDDRIRDLLRKYVKDVTSMDNLLKELDDAGFGAKRDPKQLIAALNRFASDVRPKNRIYDPCYRQALDHVRRNLSHESPLTVLEYRSSYDIVDAMSNKEASAGFEGYITGKFHKGEYMDIAMETFSTALTEALETGTMALPIRCFHRLTPKFKMEDGHVSSVKCKDRLVSAVSFSQITLETQFTHSMQRYLCNQQWYAVGKTPRELRSIVLQTRRFGNAWVSIDYSAYDQSIPDWLIRDAFRILWDVMFCGRPVGRKYRAKWDIMVNDFIHKAFIGPEGRLVYANHGVPSGSMWTNIVDSVCNLIIVYTYFYNCKRRNTGLKDIRMCVCGDDNLVGYKGNLDIEDMAAYINTVFGVVVNAEKCTHGTVKDDPHFLSRVWRINGEWRDPNELLAKLCYPERRRPYIEQPELKPEHIILCYIDTYNIGMRQLMDVDAFMMEHATKERGNLPWQAMTGFMKYERQYIRNGL